MQTQTRTIACALVAAHALACTKSTVVVHVPAPEMRAALRDVGAHARATVRDEDGETRPITTKSELTVTGDDGKPHVASIFTQLDACALKTPNCFLDDPHAQFRLTVTKKAVDIEALEAIGFISLGVVALGGIGTLIGGNVACFSGPCDDGWKAVVIGGDVVVGTFVVLSAVVLFYGLTHLHTH